MVAVDDMVCSCPCLIDCEAIHALFPWAGLVSTGEGDRFSRYREMMAEARRRP